MHKIFYCYEDSEGLTREVLAWAADPASLGCEAVEFLANSTLTEEACRAFVPSPAARTVTTLELHEIYLSPGQLADLLTLPALVTLRLLGGHSQDWGGMEFTFPTLKPEHLAVLMTSPDARRLRTLELAQQELDIPTGHQLRAALPDLETLLVEGAAY